VSKSAPGQSPPGLSGLWRVGYVIPTLGQRNEWLAEAVASVRNCGKAISIVIVTDQPSEALLEIAATADATVIAQSSPGVFGALNDGVAHLADSIDLFGFLGDDDLLLPDAVAKLTSCFDDERVVAAYGRLTYINAAGMSIMANNGHPILARFIRWLPNLIPNPGALIRVRTWRSVNGFDQQYKYAADLDLWLKLARIGRIKHCAVDMAKFRFHSGSLTSGSRSESLAEARQVRLLHSAGLLLPLHRLLIISMEKLGEFVMKRLMS
jgi:GT2 family glycosyltransferase